MKSKWLGTKAEEHVKRLLQQAGIPLQIKVRSLCREFCQSHGKSDQTYITTEKVVYAPSSSEEKYREIDQRVQIYEEFEGDEFTGIQLIVNLPIECKYRADIEIFGFPTSSAPDRTHEKFPISGALAGSTYFSLLRKSYSCLSELHPFDIGLAKIEKGQKPVSICKENLIYNAAGSLYDFVLFDLEGFKGGLAHDPIVEGLFQKFQSYLVEHHYHWSSVLRRWIDKEIDFKQCEEFSQKHFGNSRIYHSVAAHLPIVCIDGPLYRVRLNPGMDIEGFDETLFLATSIRKQGWPGSIAIELLRKDPVVPVVITNPSGLNRILGFGYEWYQDIKRILQAAPRTLIKRWALESAFFQKVYDLYEGTEKIRYRSDLDHRQWF